MERIDFNLGEYNFVSLVKKRFKVDDLSLISDQFSVFKRNNDQSTSYHKEFYSLARESSFQDLYRSFISEVIYPLYNEPIVYQAIPTFRVCLKNNIAVGEFHKDKHYRDVNWAIKVKEDNYFLPLTEAFDTNTIWVESEEDKGDFSPMVCSPGQFYKWDGCNLNHGNKINQTGKCRVSFDFRVCRKSNFIPLDKNTINTSLKFDIGGYYNEFFNAD
tara:strand:+ start:987 stop:1634 length:648 start_codon:yes stop_codon:yes gene_type:complete